ncbi:MAG: RHS repeat-associated core domain-containing protein, partial [Deltaproteobacteria bacterium]|nr:RHS repeat-associated core domain-containing protein [Deltaproteobacteria bacterium]
MTEDGEVITEIVVEGVRFGQKRSGEAKPTPIVTDPRGAVLQLGGETLPAFGAFGENTQAPSAFDERHLFAGLESIPEAPGVMLAQHRAYHPRTGRFLSPDPLGLAGGMFRTRYAEGDGVNLVDPTGWSAGGPSTTDYGQMAESGDNGDGPSKGVEGGGSEKNTSSQSASLCSLSPFACGGMDTGNLGPQRKRGCFGAAPDEGEATGDVDASLTGRKGTSIHTDPATGATTQVNITVGERCTQDCANRDVFRPAGSTDTYEYINHGPVSGEGALPGGDAQGDGADPTAPGESSGESSPTTEGEGSLIGLGTTREHGGGQDGGGGDGGTGKFRRVSELSRLGDAFDFGVKGGLGVHAAMMLESIPATLGLLGGLSGGLAQQLTQTALDRSGAVKDLRAWSIDQYQQGLAISPSATNAGVVVGVGGAVLVDVAIPGLGVEMSMAARAQRAAFEPATNVSQQVLREATGALGRADDQIHHIMTNKNWVSDATGGPW